MSWLPDNPRVLTTLTFALLSCDSSHTGDRLDGRGFDEGDVGDVAQVSDSAPDFDFSAPLPIRIQGVNYELTEISSGLGFEIGDVLVVPDVDADGTAELVFGDASYRPSRGLAVPGAVVIVPVRRLVSEAGRIDAFPRLVGPYDGAEFGSLLALAGDIDEDGVEDLAIATDGQFLQLQQAPFASRREACATDARMCGVVWLLSGADFYTAEPVRGATSITSDGESIIGSSLASIQTSAGSRLAIGTTQQFGDTAEAAIFGPFKLDGSEYAWADGVPVETATGPAIDDGLVFEYPDIDGDGGSELLVEVSSIPGPFARVVTLAGSSVVVGPPLEQSLGGRILWTGWNTSQHSASADPILPGTFLSDEGPAAASLRRIDGSSEWAVNLSLVNIQDETARESFIRTLGFAGVQGGSTSIAGVVQWIEESQSRTAPYRGQVSTACLQGNGADCDDIQLETFCPHPQWTDRCARVQQVHVEYLNEDRCLDFVFVWSRGSLGGAAVSVLISSDCPDRP